MNSNWSQQPFSPSKPKAAKKPANFLEALKSSALNSKTTNPDQNQWGREWLGQTESDQYKEYLRRERHKEVTRIDVFSRREEEVKQAIKSIQAELKLLVEEIAKLSQDITNATEAEVVNPGTYHLNFFEKLRRLIVMLRKQVVESQNWLEISYARKRAQNSYWAGFYKSGTKFSLSSERYSNNSAG